MDYKLYFVCAIGTMIGCSAASFRRLWCVHHANILDFAVLASALPHDAELSSFSLHDVAKVKQLKENILLCFKFAQKNSPGYLLAMALTSKGESREAFLSEYYFEWNYFMTKWQRVPKVCASLASTLGLLLALLLLQKGLFFLAVPGGEVLKGRLPFVEKVTLDGLAVMLFCLSGASVGLAVQRKANQIAGEMKAQFLNFFRVFQRVESWLEERGGL